MRSTFRRLAGILTIAALFGPGLAAEAGAAPAKSAGRDAFLAGLADKPASQLLAMARQARDAGRFDEAAILLQTSLDSPWGRRAFQENLKDAVRQLNLDMNGEPDKLERLVGYKPAVKDPLLFSTYEYERDPVTREEKVRLEMQSSLPKPFGKETRALLLNKALQRLAAALRQKMPANPLRYYESHGSYFVEGYFNAEYPAASAEADLELGLVYKSLQDFVQAEHYLDLALKRRSYLQVPGREYEIRYALAEIYILRGKPYEYEKSLLEIVSRDRPFVDQNGALARQREQMRRLVLAGEGGLDKMLQLYRVPDDFSLDAHRRLGLLYLQHQDYEQAYLHLVFAVVKPVSKAMEEIRARDFDYSYTTMADFLAEARDYPEIMDYLRDSGLFESLYNLAQVLPGVQPNYDLPSRAIYRTLAATPEAGPYQAVAAEKIAKRRR